MSDKRDPKFDPDATVTGPLHESAAGLAKQSTAPGHDPDATVTGPLFGSDPDQTVSLKPPEPDPDATITGPLFTLDPDKTVSLKPAEPDPDATISGPVFTLDPDQTLTRPARLADPDATISGPIAAFDPDATVSNAPAVAARRRANPFAPKALPEELQANLAALGGLNPLVALANPIFGVVPEIRAAQTHPDPAMLQETLAELIEAFEAGAHSAGFGDAIVEAAVYALCCLVDDAASATPWGGDWIQTGLLQKLRSESGGGEEFFSLLAEVSQHPEANADLLEFDYICMSLGFEGRYRGRERGREELDAVRGKLHALITRRRPRPVEGLSGRWRGVTAAPARAAARSAAQPAAESRLPWGAIGAAAAALLVLYAGYSVFKPPAPGPRIAETAVATGAGTPVNPPSVSTSAPALPVQPPMQPPVAVQPAVQPPVAVQSGPQPTVQPVLKPTPASPEKYAPKPAAPTVQTQLADEIRRGLVALSEDAGGVTIAIRHDRQFALGDVQPDAQVRAVIETIGGALDAVPGTILVTGHADSLPVKPQFYASNRELSVARAQAVAELLAGKLSRPQRVTSVGAGDADPVMPNNTEENRAKNRRVLIRVTTGRTP